MSRGTKKSAGSRRTSHASRGSARAGAPVHKSAGPQKGAGEGVLPGMTAKKTTQRQGFKTNEFIVYPAHGVGQIMAIEEQEGAGCKLELFVINFVKDKMTLRVPTAKIAAVVRDLYRSETRPEQSYSERQLYEAALDRLSREISAVQRITEAEAIKEIEAALAKGPRPGAEQA